MRYTTNYDIGDRKRDGGINEDGVSITVFEQGQRNGYRGQSLSDGSSAPPKTLAEIVASDDVVVPSGNTSDDGDDGPHAGRPGNRATGVFVLADGAGGHDAGDVASYLATTVVAEHLAPVAINAARSSPGPFDIDVPSAVLPDELGPDEIQTGLKNAIIKAHREILRYAEQTGTQAYTTVVAGVYANDQLHVGWVGDSRAYLVNEDYDRIVRLTKDHAVVQQWEDEGDVDEVEAHVHPNGNEITRALGGSGHEDPDRALVEVDTRSVDLFAEDTVLVTSDGLIDAQTDAPELYEDYIDSDRSEEMAQQVKDAVVTDAEIRDILLSAESIDDAAEEYVSMANERGGKDNLSVLLFQDEMLPSTPSGGLPTRDVDPDVEVSERSTVIIPDE